VAHAHQNEAVRLDVPIRVGLRSTSPLITLTPLPFVYTLPVVMAMVAHRRRRKADAMAAAGVTVRAIRDLADACPPLKSVAAAVVVVWDMSKVRTYFKTAIDPLRPQHTENEVEQEGLQAARESSCGDCS
jgi:hypothetical protein